MNKIVVKAIVNSSRTDREGNTKLTFEVPPQDHALAAAIAMCVNRVLTLTVEGEGE